VRIAFVFLLVGCAGPEAKSPPPPPPAAPTAANELRTVESFASIPDASARSKALFVEASRVLLHPRCVNCHPSDDSPRQGDHGQFHDPPVTRGDDHGVPGLRCDGCHQDHNLPLARVPGAPKWGLAPKSMAWQGRSVGAICAQIKDPTRNGGKTLAQIVEHSAHDPLVAWGWAPGHDRVPAPGTQAAFGALMKAWADNGAVCPEAP
jgi:hypothetical protein